MEELYKTLTPEQVAMFKKFGQNLYGAINPVDMDRAQQLDPKYYVHSLIAALKSGLSWKSLSEQERLLIKDNVAQHVWEEYESSS